MSVVDQLLNHLPKTGQPPIDQWNPALSGDIDITIKSDGTWWHEGSEFKRESLVSLFSSILRYEDDCGYVLVSPVEKWKIQVEDVPFMVIGAEQQGDDWRFALKHGQAIVLGAEHRLVMRQVSGADVPYIYCRDGLYARVSRPVYYQLVDSLVQHEQHYGLWSQGEFFAFT